MIISGRGLLMPGTDSRVPFECRKYKGGTLKQSLEVVLVLTEIQHVATFQYALLSCFMRQDEQFDAKRSSCVKPEWNLDEPKNMCAWWEGLFGAMIGSILSMLSKYAKQTMRQPNAKLVCNACAMCSNGAAARRDAERNRMLIP